jgi:peptidoglycan/xylan/chitin deacetylase (PgdA/CDA1 family)
MAIEAGRVMNLDRGVFTISLDFEMIWGTQDLFGPERFRKACETERACVIDRLLDLLVEYELSATWFVVGHLMLDHCDAHSGLKHPEIVRPTHSWTSKDWFKHDPGGCEVDGSVFLGRSLVKKILACRLPQEIGCHTFSHTIFGDPGCSRASAVSELKACVWLADEMGIEMSSFAFPRNKVGHLDVLREYGFSCYRGPEPEAPMLGCSPDSIKRVANLWKVLVASEPPVGLPEKTESGLWMIPGSMVYFPMHGLRRYIPVRARTRRAIKGLNAAVRQKRIFHLWFHPTNLAEETERMFAGLRRIFDHASLLRVRGQLDVFSMGSLLQASGMPAFSSAVGDEPRHQPVSRLLSTGAIRFPEGN